MTTTLTLDDEAFITAVTSCELSPSGFGHLQHLRLGWLHLRSAPLDTAIERTCSDIARFATHYGADDKFHRTMTEALLRLMAHGGAVDATQEWPCFLQRNPSLLNEARSVLERHYSPTLLASPEARRHFLPPDRLPLPA